MKPKSKIGILKYIAKTKGIKFNDEPETWYNPATKEAGEMVKDEYKNKEVEIILVDGTKNEFLSVTLLESEKKEEDPLESEAKALEIETAKEEIIDLEKEIPEEIKKKETGEYTSVAYNDMEKTKVETAKKGNLTYASWAEVWSKLKKQHPTATYEIYEDAKTGMPFINDPVKGAFVKVSVTVMGITHTVFLPVMDHMNKAVIGDKLDVFIINKNIQRCFAKAIAMHGISLYLYKGEDFPSEK